MFYAVVALPITLSRLGTPKPQAPLIPQYRSLRAYVPELAMSRWSYSPCNHVVA